MPHLSPIIWTCLFMTTWCCLALLVIFFEFTEISLRR